MAPNSDLAPVWRFVASLWRRLGKSVHYGRRTGRQPMLGRLAIVLAVLGLNFGAHAQVDTNRFCRDRNPDGYYDCGWFPTRIGAATYTIPGPIKAVQDSTEGGVIGQYKEVIAANAGSGLCSSITRDLGDYERALSGPVTNWELAGFWQREVAPVVFTYAIWEGTGPSRQCVPRQIPTQVYRYRDVGCANGWTKAYDSPARPDLWVCYRQPSGSRCPVGNPITMFEQNKLLDETDLPPVSPRSIEFRRTYNSIGPFGIEVREGRFSWEDLGTYWRHNYSGRVEPTSDGANVTVSRGLRTTYFRIRATLPDGRIEYEPVDRDQRDRLVAEKDANGFFVRVLYTSPDNVLEEYQFGRLVKVTTSDGYWQRLTYRQFFYSTGEPGDLKIDRISDAFGRQLSFAYSNDNRYPIEGLLTSVTDVEGLSLGFEYNFVFETSPSLPTGTYAVNLIAVTQRDGSVRRYLYGEASSFPAYGPVRMTAMTGKQDELGVRVGTYRYDGSGLAISTESAGGVNKYQVASNSYIDPLGTSYSAQVTLAAGLNRIAGWYQPAGAGCGCRRTLRLVTTRMRTSRAAPISRVTRPATPTT